MLRGTTHCLMIALVAALATATASAEEHELPLGQVVEGALDGFEPTEFVIEFQEAGILTVAVRAKADDDLVLSVVDAFYQEVPNGRSDMDLDGNTGAEQVAAIITRPGEYRVLVEPFGFGGGGGFTLVSGFLPYPDVAAEVDAESLDTPDTAHDLGPNDNFTEDLLVDESDRHDWYRIEAPGRGSLTVSTTAAQGDLQLHAYLGDNFREEVDHSDQDLRGDTAREEVELWVDEGEVYFIRVSTVFGHEPVQRYRIRAEFEAD